MSRLIEQNRTKLSNLQKRVLGDYRGENGDVRPLILSSGSFATASLLTVKPEKVVVILSISCEGSDKSDLQLEDASLRLT